MNDSNLKVPFLDLKGQYQQIRNEIHEALEEILKSQQFILGPKVKAFEEAVAGYCGCAHAIGVSSGTDALIISLMAAGIGPGHGVITTPFTFFATAGAIVRVGARPFFVDIDPVSYNIDPEAIRTFIERSCRRDPDGGILKHRDTGFPIRGIIPVHLYGQCADMDAILDTAQHYDLIVIEDAAQAIGATYPLATKGGTMRCAGTMGNLGCLSFFPTKNLGGFGDGGMVTADDGALAEKVRILRVHGSNPKYYHHLVGGNFRLDALQAAVLLVKLEYLDDWTAKRRENASTYDSLFQQSGLIARGSVTTPRSVWEDRSSGIESRAESRTPRGFCHIYNQYIIRARRRDELKAYLTENGIGTEIYYPLSLHQQKCFSHLSYRKGDFPESEKAAANTLALPIYPELEQGQLQYIVDRFEGFYKSKRLPAG